MTRSFEELSPYERNIVGIVREADEPLMVGTISSLAGILCAHTTSGFVTELAREGYLERKGDKYGVGENNGN